MFFHAANFNFQLVFFVELHMRIRTEIVSIWKEQNDH